MDGCIYCLAGFGAATHWLANLRAAPPQVRVRLPDRLVAGTAALVEDRATARSLAVRVARNAGFARLFEHPRCLVITDQELAAQLDGRPVVCIRPSGPPVLPGPWDPGGRGWVLPLLAPILLLAGWAALTARRPPRHAAHP